MLPRKFQFSVALALLALCVNVGAREFRSNVWHDGPINCYICSSESECAAGTGSINKCENNDDQTCVTVFNEHGVVSQRGCSDSIASSQYNSYCTANRERCPTCSSSGCNDATSLNQYIECVSCDSSLDGNCVLRPNDVTTKILCSSGCMTALYPTSNASNPHYNTVRSCLNDRDVDEQTACRDGTNNKCVGCSGANCNINVFPEDRHSCYRCSDEDCEDEVAQTCVTFQEDDQCFVRFDEITNDVVEKGCLSDYDKNDEIIELIKQKALLTCKGVNCNGFGNLPNVHECTECSSDNLEACATKPTTTTTTANCRIMPYTQCYQRIKGGTTERGCLSDLAGDEFYNCLTGTDDKCKVCEGNTCNEDIIPSERLRCHRCNSQSDSTCANLPVASSVCPVFSEDDECVATYENGITKRGCGSEFTCDTDAKNCEVCSGDNCNTANIKKRVEEIYGIFQDLPLNCNTCSGDECQNGIRNPNKCERDVFQDCITVFSDQGQVVRRGCENLVMADYESYCATNPALCFNCKSNGCNDITDQQDYQQCLYCDAATNPDCLFNPTELTVTRKCALGCLSSLYPRKSNPSVYDFARTCYEDIEPDDRDSCTEADNCVKCTAEKCNTDVLPKEGRLSCYHCEGSNCDDPQSDYCLGYASDDQCYMYFDNVTYSVIRMGCRSEFTKSAILADIKQYYICDGDNCNEYSNLPEANFCYKCDSATDVNCAVAPSLIKTKARCQNYPYTECFARIRDDGHTERGCLYSLAIDDFKTCHDGEMDSKCRICTESECNKNVYPSTRHQCYRCNSSTEANCESAPDFIQACPIYSEEDACVTQWVDGITRRDCASEITCQGLSRKNCRTCPRSACNYINLADEDIGAVGLFTDLPLNCYHCNGTEDCKDSNGYFNVCQGNNQQTCTVAFDGDGNVIGRGCSDAFDQLCEGAGNLCYDCKSNGCNFAKSEADYVDCIYCDARSGDACTFDVATISNTRKCHKSCMTALYPRTSDEDPVYELIRTCLDDKDLDDRISCEASTDSKCKACSDANCNKDDLGSRKSCYQCQGDDCQDPKTQTCRAVMDNDQCFVQWDEAGSLIEMGCKSQFDPNEVITLVTAKFLWLCDDDNCNNFDNLPEKQTCTLCNSRTDSACAINPTGVDSQTSCDTLPYSQCYSRILESGHTDRGCLSNLEEDEFYNCLYNTNSTECQSCLGNSCNKEIYPSNRIACHVCSSASSASCETSPASSEVCLLYSPAEKCVSLIDSNGNTVRGCSSKVTCDTSDSSNCQVCQGNDCNVSNLKRKSDGKPGQWQQLPLTCLSCNSVQGCKSGTTQETCSEEEYCMTVFDTNGEIAKRGCSNAVEAEQGSYCDGNSDKCFNCNSNLCNTAVSINDFNECIYCDSQSDSDCALNPLAIGRHRKCNGGCMTALYPVGNSSIYEVSRSCLDDKDEADQNICLSGNSAECKACSGSACNVQLLPETRLSCLSCTGESCEEPESSKCLKYKLDDQCFMLFDNKSNIEQMGCVSEQNDSFVTDNIHRLYLCNEEDDCNNFGNIPTTTLCAVCNSNDDSDCASLPENVPGVSQCTALPNTQCYTKVNSDGSTERGCVNSLSQTQMASCLTGENSECSICNSDRCNTQVFPADRRSCQRCNTEDDPDCETSPNAASVCPVYSSNQFCASKLVNGHTYRGCSTEFQCDDSDKQYCRLCHDSDNCNVVDLASAEIGYPGKWQGVPINCYSCQGFECQGSSVGNAGKCENNNQQNCATVFAPNGTVVERGCSDQIYNGDNLGYCDQNPGHCKFCKSSGCNIATSLADYQECLFCDGTENSDCIFSPENIKRSRTCYKSCMTGLYARSDEVNPAYVLARGCLDDLDLDERLECEEGNNPYCQACKEKSCNTVKIPNTRLKCNVCVGADCSEPKSAECSSFRENDQCFTLFVGENDVQRMGCGSDLENSFIVANSRQLLLCDGDNCNSFDNFPKPTACRWCNSKDDNECASGPNWSTATVCELLPHTECYTRIDKDGITHRGCLADIDDDAFNECLNGSGETCELCSENNCNSNVFPESRRSCIQCDSSEYSACEDNASQFAKTCSIYNENDSCVTKLDGDRTIRGCSSEFSCDTSNRDTCRICNGTDNCNTINLLGVSIGDPGKWQGLPLSCYNCEGNECASGNGVLNVCQGNNLQTCTTVFGSNGEVEKRGCSDVIASSHGDYCDESPDRCPSCKSVGCNTAKSLDEYSDCYFCDSADSASCSTNFDSTKARTRKCQGGCMVALYPRTSSNDPSYELSRSCLNDKDLDDRTECVEGNDDFCKACTGSRCNTMNVPEERFECYTCLDEDCEEIGLKQCSAYHPNDQCYTLFNNESSIIAMGCRGEFEMAAVTELVKQKQMLLCNPKGCNSPDLLPTPKTCSVCNSEDNPLCSTNPNLVANIERCSALPYSDCYTRINSYNHTERGCLASLESEVFYSCLLGTDGLCETCFGDKCNEIDVYPSDRRKCQQCNSITDPLCATTPNSNKVCAVYEENDSCITNLRNGVTTRGCSSSMQCDNENDSRTCRICDSNGCNTVNLEKISEDGQPGRWQDIPITCYTCESEEDCEAKGDFRPCLNNPYQNCVTVFSAEGKVTQRGCSDAVEEGVNQSYCETNPDKCFHCNSNGCNVAASLDDYVECLSCDTDFNGDCVNNVAGISKTRKCYKQCMTAMYPLFVEESPSYGLSRSCYDDMDVDDRESCSAGNKEHCQTCSTAKCNDVAIPQQRINCYICEGDSCQDPKAQQCPTYRPDDKCHVRFDEKMAVVALGCRSELSNQEADYLVKQKRLYVCDGENCNHMDQLPVSQTCALCNSRTDSNCAVNPAIVTGQTTCANVPYTECYSRVLSDGATERGCLSNLYDDEFASCLNGTSPTCKSCKGNNCNKDIFPDSRLKCHICDSAVDPNCEASPDSLAICPLYDAEDTCVTAFRNDVTYRGCSSSVVCDGTNPRKCVKCSGEGCNTVNLAKKQDDNYGKWQDLPLTCLSCKDSACDSSESLNTTVCELNNEQDCVTVFNAAGKVVRRGCADIVDSEFGTYCDANESNCYNCKSNQCNTAVSKTEFVECVYCDTNKNLECLWNSSSATHKTRQCQGGCMTALLPSDSSTSPSYDLVRTCLNDKEKADQTTCSNNKDANCKACSDTKCNTDNVPESRLSCFICSDSDCEEPEAKSCPLYKEADQCFIKFDDSNSVSEMGCTSSFRNQKLESIIKTKRVSVCSGDNCNSLNSLPMAQKCAVCSSVDDVACAVQPIEIGSFDTCSMLPYTGCFSKLTEDGRTKRGCLTDLSEDDFAECVLGTDSNCGVCSGDGCNREIYPADRQQCFTCNSDEEPNCESFPTSKMACPIVSDTEACMTALSGNVTFRGCKTNIYCDANDALTCRSCFGSECNAIDLYNKIDDDYHGFWQDLPLKCHTCEGDQCLVSLGPAVTCSSRNINQDCMTVFKSNGQVDRRGCSDDVDDYRDLYCRQNPQLCFKCKSNECNVAWAISEYVDCAFCDSATNVSCVINPELNGFASRKCYKECMVAMKDQQIIRSCLDDKELRVQHKCQESNGIECSACTEDSCNKFTFPSDRLKCHVCSGDSCANSESQACLLYDNSDYCFAKYESGKVDRMGCASAVNASDINEWQAQNKLYKCDGNDCNELSRLPTGGECIACDSSKTPNCAQNPLLITATETCVAPSEQCVTRINGDGHTIRGCISSLNQSEQSCEAAGTCAVCTGSKCNNEVYPANRRSCHICNSVADKECAGKPNSPQICLIYIPDDSCVSTLSDDAVLTRGCASQVSCDKDDKNYCQKCNTNNCNTEELKGSADVASYSLMLTLVLAFAAIHLLNRN